MTVLTFLGVLLVVIALGTPIAFSLLICAVALMIQMDNFDTQILAQNLMEGANNFPLMAVPFFMLAGELMNAGGMSQRIVGIAQSLVGQVRGGLGYVAILAATIVASISGSAVADSAAVAALLIPMMRASGYNVPRSAGLIAAGGIIAPIIPPSMLFVIFDIEALFLFAWSVSVRESGWTGFVEALVFIAILLAGLVYLFRVGALDWAPEARRKRQAKLKQ